MFNFGDKKAQQEKKILQEIEKVFSLEKGTLTKSHRPTDFLAQVVLNPKRTKEDKARFLSILEISSSSSAIQKMEEVFNKF